MVSGEVEVHLPNSAAFEPLTSVPAPLMSREVVQTKRTSEADIDFGNGVQIFLDENTRIVLRTDDAEPSLVNLTILDGNINLMDTTGNLDLTHLLKVYRDGREVNPLQAARKMVPVIRVGPIDTSKNTPPETGSSPVVIVATRSAGQEEKSVVDSNAPEPEHPSESLSNEEILRQFRAQSGFFQRCFLNYTSRLKTAKSDQTTPMGGTVLVSFTIQPSGKVTNSKQVHSDFTDEIINKCVLEVIERTSFRTFNSQAIPVVEFPIEMH